MFRLHETEKPIMLEGAVEPVGYRVITKDFDFSAVYETDGTVNAYVEWGDDQPGDMANHESMAEAKRHLDQLMKAAEPEAKKPENDIPKLIETSVRIGLDKAGMEDTPSNRKDVLQRMHRKLVDSESSTHSIRHILIAIEDQIIELDENVS